MQWLLGGRGKGTSGVDLFLPEVDKEEYILWEKGRPLQRYNTMPIQTGPAGSHSCHFNRSVFSDII